MKSKRLLTVIWLGTQLFNAMMLIGLVLIEVIVVALLLRVFLGDDDREPFM